MTNLTRHPLSAYWGEMSPDEFQALVDDIEANGQRTPIWLFDGMVLDGWHRYNACQHLLLPCESKVLPEDESPADWVISQNGRRRSQTSSQRALAVTQCQDWAHLGVNQHRGSAPGSHPASAAQMAKLAGVSARTIAHAKVVISKAIPEVRTAVQTGKLGVKKAAPIAQLPSDEQAIAVDVPMPKPAKHAEPTVATVADDAHGDTDTIALLEDLQGDLDRLTNEINAAEADDQVAETLKWRRAYDVAVRSQSEAMTRAKESADREAWAIRHLRRCGKAVGQDDTVKIAAAVEALVRKYTEVAA